MVLVRLLRVLSVGFSFVVVLVGVVACSGGDGVGSDGFVDDGWQPRPSRVNPHIYMAETDYMLYPDQAETDAIEKAGEAFLINCMHERGFEYRYNPYNQAWNFIDEAMYEKNIESVFSYLSVEDVAKYGIAAPGWYESANHDELFKKQKRPEGYDAALIGDLNNPDPTNGREDSCMYKAERAITPYREQVRDLNQQASDINVRIELEREAHPEVKKAEKKWAKCMSGKGFPQMKTIDGIYSPSGDPEDMSGWPAPNPGKEEIKAGTASSQCMIETGYLETASKVNAKLVHREIQKKPGLITKWKELRKKHIEAAEKYMKNKK